MQVKKLNSMNVLCFQKRTTITQMSQYVRVIARQLYAKAQEADLEVTGPVYWIYYGMDGNPQTEFTLQIALPVHQCKAVSGDFACQRLDAFTSLSELHTDKWENMPQTYEKLITEIQKNRYQMNGVCREVYIHMDFDQPQHSITEVQIGITV